jgi:hypothetical protein
MELISSRPVIGFWKVSQPYGIFSQWFKCSFVWKDIKFSSAEQFMMYRKAMLFNDTKIAQNILSIDDQRLIKKLGKEVKNFDSKIWDQNKLEIVYTGNYLKFTQNPDFKERLLGTGDAIICEASPYDAIWGIGTEDVKSVWKGQNLLGKILMKLRNDLRKEISN